MTKINDLLTDRLKGGALSKMKSLAEKSSAGNLSSFSGVFRVTPLSQDEKDKLSKILKDHTSEEQIASAAMHSVENDLSELSLLTTEIKAIQAQAVLLHGERIARAQQILKNYQDGAFTAWLKLAYGNRQTPYNFLHYFHFLSSLPEPLQKRAEQMPRQAIYALSSRKIAPQEKIEFVNSFSGESKKELLEMIQEKFPLDQFDKRRTNKVEECEKLLQMTIRSLRLIKSLNEEQAASLDLLTNRIKADLESKKVTLSSV
jgi:hypothetical protein